MFARLTLALLVSGMLFASAGQANAADYNFTALGLGSKYPGPTAIAYADVVDRVEKVFTIKEL